MKTHFRTAAIAALLSSTLCHFSSYAEPQTTAQTDDSYSLKVKKTDSTTLTSKATADKADDSSLGLKIGSKSNIQLYGTIDIGYSKWHQN